MWTGKKHLQRKSLESLKSNPIKLKGIPALEQDIFFCFIHFIFDWDVQIIIYSVPSQARILSQKLLIFFLSKRALNRMFGIYKCLSVSYYRVATANNFQLSRKLTDLTLFSGLISPKLHVFPGWLINSI